MAGFQSPYGTLGQSITGVGDVIANAITEARKAKEEAAGGQILADQALQAGVINHEQYAKFVKGSDTQKNAMIGSIVRAQAFKSKQAEDLDRDRRTRLAFQQYNRQLTAEQFIPPSTITPVKSETGEAIAYPLETSPGQFVYKEPPESGPGGKPVDTTKATRVRDIETGEQLPFYSLPLGPKQSQVLGVPEAGGAIRLNPETGLWERWTGKIYEAYPAALQLEIWRKQLMAQHGVGTKTTEQTQAAAPAPTAAAPSGTPKQLTPDVAQRFLNQAGGDKVKARELAKAAGYVF